MKKLYSTRDITLAGLFCALMIVGANLKIYFGAMPLTFQPLFAILAGLLLGTRVAMLSQISYVLLGLIGLPVFAAGGAGPAYVLQPTFGFLLGFVLIAAVSGHLSQKNRKAGILQMIGIAFLSLLLLYVVGIGYMYIIQHLYLGKSVTLVKLVVGMMPFFLKDAVFYLAAAVLSTSVLPIVRRLKIA